MSNQRTHTHTQQHTRHALAPIRPDYYLFFGTVLVAMAHMSMAHMRDTKWLTLEVCREFQRGTCSRSDQECKFAHPAKSCQVENGRVIACFDSLKVRRKEIRHSGGCNH